ncbi:FtsB family cell division protein [Lichenicola sp.]|uniref:FtsB family cell division protein n=1 Tax=Lichenicola sp. TaxID=2804529 RepID=UPI003B004736
MSFGRAVKRKVKAVIPPVLFLSLVGYFGWNATQGDHGLRSYRAQLQLLQQADDAKQAALFENAAWNQRVSGLRDKGLDADTLDERSRAMLNLAEPTDIVVPYGKNKLY